MKKKKLMPNSPAVAERRAQYVAPMSAAMRARMEKERFVYPPGQLPWRAERMLGPVYVPTGMTYRGQRA